MLPKVMFTILCSALLGAGRTKFQKKKGTIDLRLLLQGSGCGCFEVVVDLDRFATTT